MIRLVLVLGAGLFAAMLIGGQDRGQMRFGLMPAPVAPVASPLIADDVRVQEGLVEQAALDDTVAQAVDPVPTPIEDVSFAPAEPVMAPQAATTEVAQGQVQPTPVAPNPVSGKILFVAVKSVNVREGPGKDFGVVSRLARGEAVLVVSAGTGPDGWSLIRIEGDGVEGYVASRLLKE